MSATETTPRATSTLPARRERTKAAPPPLPEKRGIPLSLRWKLFGAVVLLVLVVVAAALAAVQFRAASVARATIDQALRTTGSAFTSFLAERFGKASSAVRQLAGDPNTVAAITTADSQTVLDYLESKRTAATAESLLVLDRDGLLLARTDEPLATGTPLGDRSPIFGEPLAGRETSGFAVKGSSLRILASAPAREGMTIAGALVGGFPVDADFAAKARQVTNADATFLLASKEPVVAASSLAGEDSGALAKAFTGTAAGRALWTGGMAGNAVAPTELEVRGERLVAVAIPLLSASGEKLGLFVASRSLRREMAPFLAIRDALLAAGAGAVVLAFLVSFLLARRITRPVTALAAAAREVRDGKLDVTLPPAPNDEVGELSDAFARMLAELRHKEELEDLIDSLSAGRGTSGMVGGTMAPGADSAITATAGPVGSGARLEPGGILARRFEVVEVLGAGAMGMVYRAKDRELDEEVAIKTIRGEVSAKNPGALDAFKTEIRLARKITNKHVLRTYDFGDADGVSFLTMEYVRGMTLKQLLEKRRLLPLGPGLHVARQICDGLSAAHEQGVVHRDVKPQNMLVTPKGDLKLMDFGISVLAGGNAGSEAGMVVGTPDYMSPEQAQGRPADARSDIYSTGVVLYELFSGSLPFTADTAVGVVLKHVKEAPAAPRQRNPQISPALERVILRAMAKSPAERYQKISDLKKDLEDIGA